ncbi:hypothetical protein PYCCODRAFT_1377845, partial [Trametes coccinea BRFM310]
MELRPRRTQPSTQEPGHATSAEKTQTPPHRVTTQRTRKRTNAQSSGSPSSPAISEGGRGAETRRQADPTAPAETGRAESAREFAKRIRRVVLHGPRVQPQEGEGWTSDTPTSPGVSREADRRVNSTEGVPAERDERLTTEASGDQPSEKSAATLLTYLAENPDGIDLTATLKGRYGEDVFFRRILEAPKAYKNFHVHEDGLIYLHEQGRDVLCIPSILYNGRSVREVVISHAHSLLAHLGSYKTLGLLRDHVWWKS